MCEPTVSAVTHRGWDASHVPLAPMERRRIDTLLAERGLAVSRTRAAESVRAGRVRIGREGPRATKPGQLVPPDTELLIEDARRYVSRGGFKLENALEELGVDVTGRSCLDVGASTGGFTDALLQRGAERVVAVDVGYGQFDWSLRNDPRVTVMERTNVRRLTAEDLPFDPDLLVADLSFISLTVALESLLSTTPALLEAILLVKPQFEAGPESVGRGGLVRDQEVHVAVILGVE